MTSTVKATLSPDQKNEQIKVLRSIIKDNSEETCWDEAWQKGVTPWDDGILQPAFREFMESEKGKEILAELGSDKRALVPGCGKGYDVAYLAENGFQAWGMDLSPTAVEEAQKFWASADESVKAKMSFRQGDYFNFEIPEGRFDVMYDYTFFCAFPPSMREAYGKRVREIVRIGGYFVGLVYPIDGGRTGGPPYSVSVEALSESIHGASEWTKVVEFVPKVSTESHVNRERFVVWKRIA